MKHWTIDDNPSGDQLDEIASVLRAGGVVLMPTDTIYGLHAMFDSPAVDRIDGPSDREQNDI